MSSPQNLRNLPCEQPRKAGFQLLWVMRSIVQNCGLLSGSPILSPLPYSLGSATGYLVHPAFPGKGVSSVRSAQSE